MSVANTPVRVKYIGSALPGNAETVNLFSSVVSFAAANALPALGMHAYHLNLKHDAAGTVKGYRSVDRGVTWSQYYDSGSISAPASTTSTDLVVSIEGHADVKFDWLNGATPQTLFSVSQNLSEYP